MVQTVHKGFLGTVKDSLESGGQEEQAEIDTEEMIKSIRKVPPKYWTMVIILCLLFLCYYLGFAIGFNQAFHLQKDYYEKKMEMFCVCREEPNYSFRPRPLEVPLPDSKNK